MKVTIVGFLVVASLVSGIGTAADIVGLDIPKTDQQRIDSLIVQNRMLTELVASLKSDSARPKTKEEAFIACMQAAKGSPSAMAAESIGGHCDQLLKK